MAAEAGGQDALARGDDCDDRDAAIDVAGAPVVFRRDFETQQPSVRA